MNRQQMRETKESELFKRKLDIEKQENENKQKYLLKQEQKEERIKLAKEDKEKENLNKSNKMYISATNNRIRYLREENAKEYKRNLKMESMTKRLAQLKEKKQKKDEETEERRRLEDEINKDKQVMMNRLQAIFQSDGEYTKDEVNDYVFKGVKPKKKKKEEQNKSDMNNDENNNQNENENNEKNENNENNDENKKNGDNAFLTSLPQN